MTGGTPHFNLHLADLGDGKNCCSTHIPGEDFTGRQAHLSDHHSDSWIPEPHPTCETKQDVIRERNFTGYPAVKYIQKMYEHVEHNHAFHI